MKYAVRIIVNLAYLILVCTSLISASVIETVLVVRGLTNGFMNLNLDEWGIMILLLGMLCPLWRNVKNLYSPVIKIKDDYDTF